MKINKQIKTVLFLKLNIFFMNKDFFNWFFDLDGAPLGV